MGNKKPYDRNNKTYNKRDRNYYRNNNNKNINEDSPMVRMDQERINDIETLDTSFLEGRITGKKSKAVKEKLLKDNKKTYNFAYLKYILIALLIIVLFVGLCLFLNKVVKSLEKDDPKVEEKDKVKPSPSPIIEVDMDNNYLFIGTHNTNRLDFNEDYHYIKVSEDYYNTNHILNEMNTQVYQYNPTYVFIELGINELYVEEPNEDFVIRLSKIIDGIKENRPKAKIYVESIYPINRTVEGHDDNLIAKYIDNELIRTVNKDIKKMVEEKEVTYLDLYSLLLEDGNLISDYTDNGIYLNDRGLKVVYDEINKIIG